jgi:hypothetical protein
VGVYNEIMNDNNDYFANLDEIEKCWREMKEKDFPQQLRDEFWRLCMKGQQGFWQMALEDKKQGLPMVRTVPAFERAIMLLEHEQRFNDAIRMCEEANKWGINTDWYTKRIGKLKKRLV